MGDFNADPGRARAGPDAGGRVSLGVRWRRTAPSRPSPGRRGSRRRRWTPTATRCLDYIWVRGAVRVGSARLAFDRPGPRGPDDLPERPPGHRRAPRDRVGEWPTRTLRLAHRGDWRHAPENSSRRSPPPSPCRPATGSSSTSALLVRRRPRHLPRRDPRSGCTGGPDRVDALTAAALEALGVPTLADAAGDGRPRPVPRRRAEGRSRPGGSSRCSRPAAAPGLPNAVVSSFEAVGARARRPPRAGVAALAQHAHARRDVDVARRARPRAAAGVVGRLASPSTRRSVARAPRGGRLEVAAWTVRRRADLRPAAPVLGVVAVCVEAAALDG